MRLLAGMTLEEAKAMWRRWRDGRRRVGIYGRLDDGQEKPRPHRGKPYAKIGGKFFRF